MSGHLVRTGLAITAVLVLAGPATAQLQTQPRDYAAVFGGAQTSQSQSRHQLTLDFLFLGGYDDDVGRPEVAGTQPTDPRLAQSSSFGEGSASLTYRYGRQDRYFQLNANTNGRTYSTFDYDVQVDGGGSAEFYSPLGRSTTFRATHAAGYRNYFLLGSFGGSATLPQPQILPTTNASFGLTRLRAVTNDAAVDLTHRWSRSHSSSIRGAWSDVRYPSDLSTNLRSLQGHLQHSIAVTRSTSVAASYFRSDGHYAQVDGPPNDVKSQTLNLSLSTDRRLSPSRRLFLEVGGGGSRIDTVSLQTALPIQHWQASAHGRAATDLGRSWNIQGSYDRGWSMNEGFSQPLFADTAALSAAGFLGRRVDLVLGVTYAIGEVGVEDASDYESWAGSVQSRYAFGRNSAIFVSYLYYYYDLKNPVALPNDVPQQFDRQVFRVGVTFWVPLAGVFPRAGGSL